MKKWDYYFGTKRVYIQWMRLLFWDKESIYTINEFQRCKYTLIESKYKLKFDFSKYIRDIFEFKVKIVHVFNFWKQQTMHFLDYLYFFYY